jgi:hypothetical protein
MVTLALVAESNADPLKRLKLCLSVLVAVDLLGDGQARVAEDELGVAGPPGRRGQTGAVLWMFQGTIGRVCRITGGVIAMSWSHDTLGAARSLLTMPPGQR